MFQPLMLQQSLVAQGCSIAHQPGAARLNLDLCRGLFLGDALPPMAQRDDDGREQEQAKQQREGHALTVKTQRDGKGAPLYSEKTDRGVGDTEQREHRAERAQRPLVRARRAGEVEQAIERRRFAQ